MDFRIGLIDVCAVEPSSNCPISRSRATHLFGHFVHASFKPTLIQRTTGRLKKLVNHSPQSALIHGRKSGTSSTIDITRLLLVPTKTRGRSVGCDSAVSERGIQVLRQRFPKACTLPNGYRFCHNSLRDPLGRGLQDNSRLSEHCNDSNTPCTKTSRKN